MADDTPTAGASFRVPAHALDPLASSDEKLGAVLSHEDMAPFDDQFREPQRGPLLIDVRTAASMLLVLVGIVLLLVVGWLVSTLVFLAGLAVVSIALGVALGFSPQRTGG